MLDAAEAQELERGETEIEEREGRIPCRFCRSNGLKVILDLGPSPLANAFLTAAQLSAAERFYALTAYRCPRCSLVQLPPAADPEEIFADYPYLSSYSESWLEHARRYSEMAIERFSLGPETLVVEIASNDGYLLQYFVERGIPVLGIDPAANAAALARERGVPTRVEFFGHELAARLARDRRAELIVANNVLAHVPDLNGFVRGLKALLKPEGTITLEFPSLARLIAETQFDTIYHEHLSYFSLTVARKVFQKHGLAVCDVEELPTHGGSLRLYVRHREAAGAVVRPSVSRLLREERRQGLHAEAAYAAFAERVKEAKFGLLELLLQIKRQRRTIAGYGAPAKGNTLLNYCGVRTDFVDYTVDRNPRKQGLFMPGTRIPIYPPERIRETRPDYILVLPWNLSSEVLPQLRYAREWNGKLILPVPSAQVRDA